MTYTYDRTAATKYPYSSFDLGKSLQGLLYENGTSLKDSQSYKIKARNSDIFEVTGLTADGREFIGGGRIFLEGFMLYYTLEISVEGSVDMGPLPPELELAQQLLENILRDWTAEGLYKALTGNLKRMVLTPIDLWFKGQPIDKKRLQRNLRKFAKDIGKVAVIRYNLNEPERAQLEKAVKALNAAARAITA